MAQFQSKAAAVERPPQDASTQGREEKSGTQPVPAAGDRRAADSHNQQGESNPKLVLPKKEAFVLDNFTDDDLVDVNGDGIGDISHGEVVSRLLEDKGVTVHRHRTELSTVLLASELHSLSREIDNGRAKPDAVTISASLNFRFEFLAGFSGVPNLTAENIAENRSRVVEGLRTLEHDNRAVDENTEITRLGKAPNGDPVDYMITRKNLRALLEGISSIDELTRKGVPVYVAAGNEGPGYVNGYALSTAKQVSATDEQGRLAPSSGYNALTQKLARGSFAIHKTKDGYDINENGTTDVRDDETKYIINKFTGQVPEAVLLKMPIDPEKMPSRSGIYATKDYFGGLEGFDQAMIHNMQTQLGEYIYFDHKTENYMFFRSEKERLIPNNNLSYPMGGYIYFDHKTEKFTFLRSEDGRLIPNNDLSYPNKLPQLKGTSLATPEAVAADLKKDK